MARHNEEYKEQKELIRWARMRSATLPELKLLTSIPNGGYLLSPSAASKLKATGLSAGVPDLMLPVARGGYHGLFIELKRLKGGRVSPEQRWWAERLNSEGYLAVVCYGWNDARQIIESYLGQVANK